MKQIKFLLTLALLVVGQGMWADGTISFPLHYDKDTNPEDGSEQYPYQIQSIEDLNTLASDVNSGTAYDNKHFILMGNLDYSNEKITNGSNFTPIGLYDEFDEDNSKAFKGFFDGQKNQIEGVIVSGFNNGVGIGIFGCIRYATIKNLRLVGCQFTGNYMVGTVVGVNIGWSNEHGDYGIDNCHVTNTTVKAETQNEKPGSYAGGIIGCCSEMTVTNCTSAAIVYSDECAGGITGQLIGGMHYDSKYGFIQDCYFTGNVSGGNNAQYVGKFYGVNGELDEDDNVTVGTEGKLAITLLDNEANTTALEHYQGFKVDATLADRTLYKDGLWNTLCLPFNMTADQVSEQLAPSELKTLSGSSFSEETQELTLTFTDATTIEAGTPYIIKWTSGDNIVNPTFTDVVISNTTADVETDYVNFIGTYSPTNIYEEGTDKHNLYLGKENKLYYPTEQDFKVNAFRAYFQLLNGLTAGDPLKQAPIRSFVLNFDDDDQTGIVTVNGTNDLNADDAWYTLDGCRLANKPVLRGIYIHNGKKVIIK